MNKPMHSDDKKENLIWRDSVYLWIFLILIQIFFFTLITFFLLEISGWNFNEPYLFFGIYGSTIGVWLSIIVTEMGVLLISFGFLRYIRKKNVETKEITGIKGFNLNNNLLGLGFVPIIFFTGIIISNIQSIFFDSSEFFIYGMIFRPKNYWELIIWIIIMFLVVGPSEEIVFRGIIQKGLQNTFNENGKPEWCAAILSGLLFSIFHVDLIRLIPIFFMGLLLGLVFYSTDSSMVCAITHGVYNSVTIILMFVL